MSITQQTIVREIADAWRVWNDAVAGLSDADFASAQLSDGWTLKDVVGHLATYLRLNVRHLESAQRRKRLASMGASWRAFNTREAKRLKSAPLAPLRAELDAAYDDLQSHLSTLSDADLRQTFPAPWRRDTQRRVRLGTILRVDVSRHLLEHARDVQTWRSR